MKTTIQLLLLLLLPNLMPAQETLKKNVVRISAINEFGDSDIGAGIIVGNTATELYIATALHVVKASPQATVYLADQNQKHTATVVQRDEKLDIAVIKMNLPKRPLPHLLAVDPKILEVQQKVLSIGHPGGSYWKANYQNIIQELAIYGQPDIMSITPQGIIGGCSGGAVFTYEGIWMGMITESSAVEAKCVKAATLIQKLKSWHIPANLTVPEQPQTVRIAGSGIVSFSIGKYEVSFAEFERFIAATGYVTDAEKEGYSWTFYNRSEGEFVVNASRKVFEQVFTNIQKQINATFTSSHRSMSDNSPLHVLTEKLYDLFDYSDLGLRYNDPAKAFLYEVFDEYDYTINDNELEAVLDKMRERVNREYREYNFVEAVFEKLQYKINYEFKFTSSTGDLTEELQLLQNLLLQSFDYQKLDISDYDFAERHDGPAVNSQLKYLDRVNWRHDAIGLNRNALTKNYPIIHISYNDAEAYCNWLSELHDTTYRLPSVKEWEYAATQGGKLSEEDINQIHHAANLRDQQFCNWTNWEDCNGNDDGFATLAPITAFPADAQGIYQIHGNVAEWCTNGEGYSTQSGSHFQSFTRRIRDMRAYHKANFRSAMVGFRVIKQS